MIISPLHIYLALSIFLLTSCTSNKLPATKQYSHYIQVNKPYKVNHIQYKPMKHDDIINYHESGLASWYTVPKRKKARTATGELFNPKALTAAHRTLPFMSVVKVKAYHNNKEVKLIINDRGPFKSNRIIDVSEGAAEALDFKRLGVTKVSVEYLPDESAKLKAKLCQN